MSMSYNTYKFLSIKIELDINVYQMTIQ